MMKFSRTFAFAAFSLLTVFPLCAQTWTPIPILTAAMKKKGIFPGGEGAQGIRTIAISPTEPDFIVIGTDVGGIYRSRDGGKHWQVCMVGWGSRGGNAFAIDPKNSRRVIGAGGNSMDWDTSWGPSLNGLYLSTDSGASWKQTLPSPEGNEWRAESLAYDPASYNAKRGFCETAYWSSRDNGLYKTKDGGAAWAQVSTGHNRAAIKTHPTRGFVYLADSSAEHPGFYRSEDGGVTFKRLNNKPAFGIDVVATRPDTVYVTRPSEADKVWISEDCGVTFRPLGMGIGLPPVTPYMTLSVSPLDPQNVMCNFTGDHWYESYTCVSKDGGQRWWAVYYNRENQVLPFLSAGNRFAFSLRDKGVVFGTQGNGTLLLSEDSGETFRWHSNGLNAVMLGSSFGFNPASPNTVFLSFQDFEGAVTQDGGKTWAFTPTSTNAFGGWEYGGFTLDGQVLWSGHGTGWAGPRTLAVSRDGGKTWTEARDAEGKIITFEGQEVGYADPLHPGVCFEAGWRSSDSARTWKPMSGCDTVYIGSPEGKTLFGRHGNRVCRSSDGGVTWTDLTSEAPGGIRDVAYDPVQGRVYIASEDRVKAYDLAGGKGDWQVLETPTDVRGARRIWSVCVDPQAPRVVYAGGPANIYATDATVVRSLDGGKTWQNLTVTSPLKGFNDPGGPHEVEWVRVHPKTRELWAAGECYGMWKLAPPSRTPMR